MMDETLDPTAWSALLVGLYTLFAAIGALRRPEVWRKMLVEVDQSASLQLVAGLLELVLGAAIYLANPWVAADVLTCVLKSIGGVLMFEALAIIGIKHEPSDIAGKRDWYTRSGEYIGAFDAHEGWAKLKQINAIAEQLRA